jgi:FlaA1/EpsC-like NDP-sugar epimerase
MLKNIYDISKILLKLPRFLKQSIAVILDACLCFFSTWFAFYLRLDEFFFLQGKVLFAALIAIVIALPVFWILGLYRTIFRYSETSVMSLVSLAILVYGSLYFSIFTVYGVAGIPRSIGIVQPILLFLVIICVRLFAKYLFSGNYTNNKIKYLPKALVYGAGSAGRQLVSALKNSFELKIVGFLDDDNSLHGQILQGHKIFSPKDLGLLIQSQKISHVLLALPSVSRNKRAEILKNINKHKVIVKTLPSIFDIVKGRITVSDIKDLDVDDILNREEILPDFQLLNNNINLKTVLVTGAGGSIGSELCRQIIKLNPYRLLLVDSNEYALYKIYEELAEITNKNEHNKIIPLLASIQNEISMLEIVKAFKPITLYHAAAYKHVPLVEENISEGVKNNVFGTLNILNAALVNNVLNFTMISSDKAVRPTNVMGASKRLAELCVQSLSHYSKKNKTKISIVRFGNVIESSGSVIPKFKRQIRDGGPITLTHPEVTRYFMTVTEAAQLVIQASAMTEGSDVFVLDMGESVKIKDLIYRIVKLSGLTVKDKDNLDGDIEIKITGLRPGEKLYEELLLGNNPQKTKHPKIQKAQEPFMPWIQLEIDLNTLKELIIHNKVQDIKYMLKKIVDDYDPINKIVDHVYNEQTNSRNNIL